MFLQNRTIRSWPLGIIPFNNFNNNDYFEYKITVLRLINSSQIIDEAVNKKIVGCARDNLPSTVPFIALSASSHLNSRKSFVERLKWASETHSCFPHSCKHSTRNRNFLGKFRNWQSLNRSHLLVHPGSRFVCELTVLRSIVKQFLAMTH